MWPLEKVCLFGRSGQLLVDFRLSEVKAKSIVSTFSFLLSVDPDVENSASSSLHLSAMFIMKW